MHCLIPRSSFSASVEFMKLLSLPHPPTALSNGLITRLSIKQQ
uniref:Uncharacterized protein n=1 Tax=Physcomitrium patens TaxID=3218 RepID=A0A2K1JS79_PHYPA|nr:hypothetical protein PHYPA_016771 [Physcomitrium patens]